MNKIKIVVEKSGVCFELREDMREDRAASGSHPLAAAAPDQLRLRRGRVLRLGRAPQLLRAAPSPAGLISTSLQSEFGTEGYQVLRSRSPRKRSSDAESRSKE